MAPLSGLKQACRRMFKPLNRDESGVINFLAGLSILGIVIGAVIAVKFIASSSPSLFASVGDMTAAINSTDFNDSTTNDLKPIVIMAVALAGLFGVVGLVFLALKFKGQ